jgi:hypothetical protein
MDPVSRSKAKAAREGNMALAHAVHGIHAMSNKSGTGSLGATLVAIRAALSGLSPEGRDAFLGDLRQFIDRLDREIRASNPQSYPH